MIRQETGRIGLPAHRIEVIDLFRQHRVDRDGPMKQVPADRGRGAGGAKGDIAEWLRKLGVRG